MNAHSHFPVSRKCKLMKQDVIVLFVHCDNYVLLLLLLLLRWQHIYILYTYIYEYIYIYIYKPHVIIRMFSFVFTVIDR